MLSTPIRLALAAVVPLLVTACGSEVAEAPSGVGGSGGGSPSTTSATSGSSTSSGDAVGAPCDQDGTLRCAGGPEPTAILACRGGRYESIGQCEAGAACQNVQGSDSVACGATFVGIEGTACLGAGTQACSLERDVVLGCDDGVWSTRIHCAPVSCRDIAGSEGELCNGIWCEGCGYTLGDRCAFPAGTVNCSTDGATIVECVSGTVTAYEDCGAAGLSCVREGAAIHCG